jgi:glycosyltransferase involved in cell wall biosynthesis
MSEIVAPVNIFAQDQEPDLLTDTVVVIPALNEEESIGHLLRDLMKIMPETSFIVVDGNSADRTIEVVKGLGVEVMMQDGKGKGAALRQALALDLEASNVIIMDADRSMRPQEIPALIGALASGADVVKGSRFLPGGSSEDLTFMRRFGARLFVHLVNLIWSTDYSDLCYGFLAFKAEAVEKISPHLTSSNFEIETEIFIKAAKLGLKVAEIPSIELKRHYGQSRLSLLRDGFLILKTIVKECLVGHRSVSTPTILHVVRMKRNGYVADIVDNHAVD